MPKDFDKCVKDGGKVRTIKHGEEKYQHICFDKNNKSHMGEILTKKKKVSRKKTSIESLFNW